MNPTWGQIAGGGVGLMTLALILWFVMRILPNIISSWERIKTRELDVRDAEAKVMGEIASALCQVAASNSQMASSLSQTAETTKSIAVEQRRSTEMLEILESSNSQQQDRLGEITKGLDVRLKVLEGKPEGKPDDRAIPAH